MIKEDIKNYLIKIVNYNNKTSYKFYLLLAILEFGKNYDVINFSDCGKEMLIQAWNDISVSDYYFTNTDKLKEIKSEIMFTENILEFATLNELRKLFSNANSKNMEKHYTYLSRYCIYRLISYGQWNDILKNIRFYTIIHEKIAKLSQEESCLYEIDGDHIILNSAYFDVINDDTEYYIGIIRNELIKYLSREK